MRATFDWGREGRLEDVVAGGGLIPEGGGEGEGEWKQGEGEIGGEERGVICECRANSKTWLRVDSFRLHLVIDINISYATLLDPKMLV